MMQKCQVGLVRLERAKARAADWAAEKRLQKSSEAKARLLKEEVSKNAGLAANLEQAQAKVVRLREEAKDVAI